MVGKKTGVKGVQSNQSPPKGKAHFNVSKRVQDLQAREEVEREEEGQDILRHAAIDLARRTPAAQAFRIARQHARASDDI